MSVRLFLIGLFGGLFLIGLWFGVVVNAFFVNGYCRNVPVLVCGLLVCVGLVGLYFSIIWCFYSKKGVRAKQ